MKGWLRKKIRKKLNNYQVNLNEADLSLPFSVNRTRSVAVIGGGIAGLSAAANLCERGFEVTLFEKENYLGGKIGAWRFESNGETLNVEHGFHAFFRQYHNLRNFMKKIQIYQHLIPIDDYLVLFQDGKKQGFKNLEPTPGLNVYDMRRFGVINWFTFVNPLSIPFLGLLRFNPEKTFKKYDHLSFEKFAKRTMMSKKMQLMFNTFARAFFSEPHQMSMAELMKGFHFYFLSNEDGLLYDVLNDDFGKTFEQPWRNYLLQHQVEIRTNEAVNRIDHKPDGFYINNRHFDYCIICTDPKHIQPLIHNSPSLSQYSNFKNSIDQLGTSDRYAVLRIWTDRFEKDTQLPFFIFTDRFACLDSITLYHKMEKTSSDWSARNNGGIFELHSYALPGELDSEEKIKSALLEELYHYLPELKGMKIKHEYFQLKQDFACFHVGKYASRPRVTTEIPHLFLAGDWVKMDNCTMLMEAAYTSGAMAANYIFNNEGLRENQLISVPDKGILA